MVALLYFLADSAPWYRSPEWWLCILGLLTLLGILWQAKATADAARATEQSVEGSTDTAKRELRAYLTVTIGAALYQERRPASQGGDLRFEARPLLVNTGKTPAKKIKFKARAAILPIPLPRETHLPEGLDADAGESILGPRQTAHCFAIVDGFCADADVASIKEGIGKQGLYVWGLINYEDVFGESHFTRFCHHMYWDRKGEIRGNYILGRNDVS